MNVELLEIRDFLIGLRVFRNLPADALGALTDALSIVYLRRGSALAVAPSASGTGGTATLDIVRSGALEIRDADGATLARLGKGVTLAPSALGAAEDVPALPVEAIEDTLLYRLPIRALERVAEAYPAVRSLLAAPGAERLRETAAHRGRERRAQPHGGALDLLATTLGDVVTRAPVGSPPTATIRETAERMNREHVTSMLLTEDDGLVGIVTDRDLRTRAIVDGVDTARPVADIMTADPITAGHDMLAHDALLHMARHRIHHLPVTDGERVVGLVTPSDFVERRASSAARLATAIYRADGVDALARESARTPTLHAGLVASGIAPARIGHVTSGVADALTRRLLELAGTTLGALPDGLAWLVTGSRARREWHVGSVSADASLLGDAGVDVARVAALARHVHDGHVRCGVPVPPVADATCPGTHLDAAGWRARVLARLDGRPDPGGGPDGTPFAALLDLRVVHGDAAPLERLREDLVAAACAEPARLARLAADALARRPPRGFFRGAVLDVGGSTRGTLDLAADGTRPIVDAARALAIGVGEDPLGTRERLVAAADGGALDASLARDLDDAFDLVAGVRARHHARGVSAGRAPDERVAPAELTRFERERLEDVFSIVREAQRALARRHGD